jgi:hypothetical protein
MTRRTLGLAVGLLSMALASGASAGEGCAEEPVPGAVKRLFEGSVLLAGDRMIKFTRGELASEMELYSATWRLLATLEIPVEYSLVQGGEDGRPLALASRDRVRMLSSELKVVKEFTTVGRSRTLGIVSADGTPVLLKHGYTGDVPEQKPPPPAPPGFSLYDQSGKVLVARDEKSGLHFGALLKSSLLVYRNSGKGYWERVLLGFDGRELAVLDAPDRKAGSEARLAVAADGTYLVLVWPRSGGGSAIRAYDAEGKAALAVETERPVAPQICGPLLIGVEGQDRKTCRVHLWHLVGGSRELRADLELRDGFTMSGAQVAAFPAASRQILVVLDGSAADGKRRVDPRVIDLRSGRQLWAGGLGEPQPAFDPYVGRRVPWERDALFSYDGPSGLAVIKPWPGSYGPPGAAEKTK